MGKVQVTDDVMRQAAPNIPNIWQLGSDVINRSSSFNKKCEGKTSSAPLLHRGVRGKKKSLDPVFDRHFRESENADFALSELAAVFSITQKCGQGLREVFNGWKKRIARPTVCVNAVQMCYFLLCHLHLL